MSEQVAMISASSLKARYTHYDVLKGIDFYVGKGEIVTLLGSNAAGKSTTMYSLMGIVPKVRGMINLDGEDISGLSTADRVKRGMVLVPEGRRIFPRMTVRDNLYLGAYLSPEKKQERVEEVFRWFPRLKERESQAAGTLSGGEQQMLAIGRALMSGPSLLLLDEPSLGLAPVLIQQIFEIIREINKRGVTIFLVEQNAHTALKIADRGYVLERGEIVAGGSSSELLSSQSVRKAYLG